MRRLGLTPHRFCSFSTCKHRGRVFGFRPEKDTLWVTEALLGPNPSFARVNTGLATGNATEWTVGCCSMGDHVLVMFGTPKKPGRSAVLRFDDGPLASGSVHVETRPVQPPIDWGPDPFLTPLPDGRVLICFGRRQKALIWTPGADPPKLRFIDTKTVGGPETLPLRLPGGALLLAGSNPPSEDIRIASAVAELPGERKGTIPGAPRVQTSTLLLDERFVLGFGGLSWTGGARPRDGGKSASDSSAERLDDFWIYDLETGRSSAVGRAGNWHPQDSLVPLILRGRSVYLLGGTGGGHVSAIPLAQIRGLISDPEIREAFPESVQPPEILFLPDYEKLRKLRADSLAVQETLSATRTELATLRSKRAHFLAMQEELQGLRERTLALEARKRYLEAKAAPGVRLSLRVFPPGRRPLPCTPRLAELVRQEAQCAAGLPQDRDVLRAYGRIYRRFLKPELLALASRGVNLLPTARVEAPLLRNATLAGNIVADVFPDCAPLQILDKASRAAAKLWDNPALPACALVCQRVALSFGELEARANSPLVLGLLAGFLREADPLFPEALMKMRIVAQSQRPAKALVRKAEDSWRALDFRASVRALCELERIGEVGETGSSGE